MTTRLRLVPTSLGVIAPFIAQSLTGQRCGPLLFELTGPDTGRSSTFEPFSPVERLRAFVPGNSTIGLAVENAGIVSLVWRNGTSFRADYRSNGPWNAETCSLHGNDELVVDSLRRAFGLATPPARFGPSWYWLRVWLHDVATRCDAGVIDVLEAARWHPGFEPDEIMASDDPAEVADRCLDRLYDHAYITGWEGVRAGAESGWLELGQCPPPLARWLDNGSFSRLLEVQLGSPARDVERLVSSDPRLTSDACAMFGSMVAGLGSMRAMDCHR